MDKMNFDLMYRIYSGDYTYMPERLNIYRVHYALGGTEAGLHKSNDLSYMVEERNNYKIGNKIKLKVKFKGQPMIICEKYAEYINDEVLFKQKLEKKELVFIQK